MKRLFVGQMVRVARNVGVPDPLLNALIGLQGRIDAIDPTGGPAGHAITLDTAPRFLRGGRWSSPVFHPDDLEPILDEHHPCEEDFKVSLERLIEREESLPA